MNSFKRAEVIEYNKSGKVATDDGLFWKKLQFPLTVKEYGLVKSIDFSPTSHHTFAVAASSKVQIYDSRIDQVAGQLTKFRQPVNSARFRSDGELIVTGDDEGRVKIFSCARRTQLRQFKGHSGPVHCAHFTSLKSRLVSFSDDKSARCWDIATEKTVTAYSQHTDYVRCGAVGSIQDHIVVTGSYDGTCHLWDTRTKEAAVKLNHGKPVESLLLFPNDSLLVSAGGTVVKVWDLLAGGRQLAQLSHHHKTITALAFCQNQKRVMSGGLDRHVKIYDVNSFNVTHTIDFPAPVLSLGVAPDDNVVVAGMTEGLLSIQHRLPDEDPNADEKRAARDISYRHRVSRGDYNESNLVIDDPETSRRKLPRHDKLLRSFQYSKVIDLAMRPDYFSRPNQVVSLFRELKRRGALRKALAGRSHDSLKLIIKFLCS